MTNEKALIDKNPKQVDLFGRLQATDQKSSICIKYFCGADHGRLDTNVFTDKPKPTQWSNEDGQET